MSDKDAQATDREENSEDRSAEEQTAQASHASLPVKRRLPTTTPRAAPPAPDVPYLPAQARRPSLTPRAPPPALAPLANAPSVSERSIHSEQRSPPASRIYNRSRPVPRLVPLQYTPRHGPLDSITASQVGRAIKASARGTKLRKGQNAIHRAMNGLQPEVKGVDVTALRAAEDMYRVLRDESIDIKDPRSPFLRSRQPMVDKASLHSQVGRQALASVLRSATDSSARRGMTTKEYSSDLSHRYNDLGMACFGSSPLVAQECLHRALIISPKDEPVYATSMCNLGALHLKLGAAAVAIRYLLRAVQIDATSHPGVRGRARLNLCSAYSMEGKYYEALDCARDAEYLLDEASNSHPRVLSRDEYGNSYVPRDLDMMGDVEVLRAVALYHCCVCHWHLRQFSSALTEARRARKLARKQTPQTRTRLLGTNRQTALTPASRVPHTVLVLPKESPENDFLKRLRETEAEMIKKVHGPYCL